MQHLEVCKKRSWKRFSPQAHCSNTADVLRIPTAQGTYGHMRPQSRLSAASPMMDDDSESTFATWRQEVYGSSKGANKLKENTKFCRTSFLLRMSRHPNGKLNVNSMFERLDGIDDAITEDEFTEFVVKGGGRGHKKCPSQKELRAVFRKISKGVFRLQRGCPLRRPSGVSSVRSRALSTVS
jgi:hypothetical protein